MKRPRRLLLLVAAAAVLGPPILHDLGLGEEASFSLGTIAAICAPLLCGVLACGVLAAAVASGRRGLVAALRFALGDDDAPREAADATLAFARGATAAGFVLAGLAALASLATLDPVRRELGTPEPADLAYVFRWLLFAPLFGLMLGRVLGGALASGAARRAGNPPPVWNDPALVLALVFPALMLAMVTVEYGDTTL